MRLAQSSAFYRLVLRGDPCAYCGNYRLATANGKRQRRRKGGSWATIDHIVAKFHGGLNAWFNYTAACDKCNSLKKHNSVLGYLLDEYIPDTFIVLPEPLPEKWYDPLGLYGPFDASLSQRHAQAGLAQE